MAKRIELRRRERRRVLVAAALLAAVTGGWMSPPQAADAYSMRISSGTHHRSQESEETLQLFIGDGGFETTQVTRGPGKFLLTADDHRSDKSQRLTLRLSRDGGEHLRDIEVPAEVADWAEEIDLPAGKYVLAVTDHLEWTCRLEITTQ